MIENIYWNRKGLFQSTVSDIQDLVPSQGESDKPLIEIFRLLQNAYYDLYNNGGGNEIRWEFVPKIQELLKIIVADKEHKLDLLKKSRDLRNSMTKKSCFPRDVDYSYSKAEDAIDSFCKLYLSLK